MSPGRRRIVRHACRWKVEAVDLESGVSVDGVTRNAGLFGCFVETPTPLVGGRTIWLRITHDGRTFAVPAEVSCAIEGEGMGIVFGEIAAHEYRVLEGWLTEAPEAPAVKESAHR